MYSNIGGPSSIPGLWKFFHSFAVFYPIGLPICHQHPCLLKLMSIQLVMPSNCFLQCGCFAYLLSIFPGTKISLGKLHSVLWESDQRSPYKMEEEKDVPSSSPRRSPKLQLGAEQPPTGECWIPPKKDIPRPRAKEKPKQDSRRGEISFRIKSHTRQWHLEGSKKTLRTAELRNPTETEPELCLSVSCGGTVGQQWPASGAGALGAGALVTQPVA